MAKYYPKNETSRIPHKRVTSAKNGPVCAICCSKTASVTLETNISCFLDAQPHGNLGGYKDVIHGSRRNCSKVQPDPHLDPNQHGALPWS